LFQLFCHFAIVNTKILSTCIDLQWQGAIPELSEDASLEILGFTFVALVPSELQKARHYRPEGNS
jgi:hypothetical protein